MEQNRRIRKIIKAKQTMEGAGVRLHRGFGFSEVPEFDPFLLFDDFSSDDPRYFIKGFPWHPHRGIETITYVLSGDVEHSDSIGNHGVIGSGDIQWMTAGSGIIHQEMPKGDRDGRMAGFQLWANLPASHKMMDPRYRGLTAREKPFVSIKDGVTAKIICGNISDQNGPLQDIIIDPEYIDFSMAPNTEYIHATKPGHTVFAYVIGGKGNFCVEKEPYSYEIEGANYFDFHRDPFVSSGNIILFDHGDQIVITTENEPIRFLLISGKPIGEPVAWYGPIVMNTQDELRMAFEEFNNGTFIKAKTQ
jgi:quercetin 2,3-dioxygenase